MIKTRINNEYKDIVKIFCGGNLQKEITKVWSREANDYVYLAGTIIEYTGTLPITITANGNALIDYRIYGASGGVGEPTKSREPVGYKLPMTVQSANLFDINTAIDGHEIYGNSIIKSSGWCISDFIPVVSGGFYIGTNLGNAFLGYQSKMGNGVRYSGINAGVTIPNTINFIIINCKIVIKDIASLIQLKKTPPVYIGDTPLDAIGEWSDYVDYASGKIVRKIAEYTFTGDESFNKYGNSDVFYTSKTIDPAGITTVNTITMRCNHSAFTAIENKDTRYWLNPEADNICCFLPGGMSQVFLRSTSNFTTATECKAYLKAQYDNGTPVKISYWIKTPIEEDPPVPLPKIPTINGTTVIDCELADKPSQMYVKYKAKR